MFNQTFFHRQKASVALKIFYCERTISTDCRPQTSLIKHSALYQKKVTSSALLKFIFPHKNDVTWKTLMETKKRQCKVRGDIFRHYLTESSHTGVKQDKKDQRKACLDNKNKTEGRASLSTSNLWGLHTSGSDFVWLGFVVTEIGFRKTHCGNMTFVGNENGSVCLIFHVIYFIIHCWKSKVIFVCLLIKNLMNHLAKYDFF